MREALSVAAYLLVVAAALLAIAAGRPLWYDEIFTLYLARSGSALELWRHLAAGTDLNPPLSYLLARLALDALGGVEWAIRVPSVLGGLLAAACVYLFVRRRRGPAEAWVALAALTLSELVWDRFIDGRPYGLACGWAALALLCWQRAGDEGSRRGRWAAGFAAALALGMLTHYYFVLVVAALGVGEMVRARGRGRIDWASGGGFAAAGVALLTCYPLWSGASKAYAGGFWSKTQLTRAAVEKVYADLVSPGVPMAVAAGLVVAMLAGVFRPRREADAADGPGYPPWEAAALAAFALLPFLGVFVGATLTAGFVSRYVVPMAVGVAPLVAFATGRTAGGRRWGCYGAAVVFSLGGVVGGLPRTLEAEREKAAEVPALTAFLNEHATGGTVVMGNPLFFLQQAHYSTDARFQIAFPADPATALRHGFPDTADRALLALANVRPLPVVSPTDAADAVRRNEPVYYFRLGPDWQFGELKDRGTRFEPVGELWAGTLYRATR